jgi:hypothetical protein
METRKDATSAIVSAATRWYMDIQPAIGRFDDKGPISALNLLTVSVLQAVQLLRDLGALTISTILLARHISCVSESHTRDSSFH